MDKKTIFLLPLDLKGQKQTRITPKFIREIHNLEKKESLPEHLKKKKSNIFTAELNRLIGKISEKNKTQVKKEEPETKDYPLTTSIDSITIEEVKVQKPKLENSLPKWDLLNNIYLDRSAVENADLYLSEVFTSLNIKGYSFFFFEPHTFTYYPTLCHGLSEKTQLNLLFQSYDKFLQNKNSGYTHLFFQPVLQNDLFFKKKLSVEEFTTYESMVLKFFDQYNLPGLLAIFFEKDKSPSTEDTFLLSEKIDKEIQPLVPYLHSYFQAQVNSKIDSYDILRRIIYSIRIQSKGLGENFYFSKVKISNYKNVESALTKKKIFLDMIRNHLLKEEGLINISFDELILLTKENEVNKIISYLCENTKTEFEFHVESMKYPENGKNLYLYF